MIRGSPRPNNQHLPCLQRDEEEAAKVYEDFVKEFGGDGPEPPQPGAGRGRGSGPLPPAAFVRGGTVRPGQPPPDAPPPITGGPAAPPGRKPGGRYIPSFMPPGMAAAMEKADGKGGEPDKGEGKGGSGSDGGGAASKSDEPVFHLPGSSSKGKPRAIDALLANLKRWVAVGSRREAKASEPRFPAGWLADRMAAPGAGVGIARVALHPQLLPCASLHSIMRAPAPQSGGLCL